MIVTFLVVCLPRPTLSETSPTACRSYSLTSSWSSLLLRRERALMMELLPAPDGPATTVTSPLSRSSSSSNPISVPSCTLTATQSYPHASRRDTSSRISSSDTRSHLFSTTVTGSPVYSAETRYRVAALGINGGMARENTSITRDMLETGGSSSLEVRGKTSSTMPRPSTQSMPTTRTTSPTSTLRFIFFSKARTTHSRRAWGGGADSANGSPSPVCSTLTRTKLAWADTTRPTIVEGMPSASLLVDADGLGDPRDPCELDACRWWSLDPCDQTEPGGHVRCGDTTVSHETAR
mmetsp:Transcript_11110/g.31057  ORF Transcript_11110/g.31057 Transcript_11110/m.31057 type:complete len:293 (+) Transcript_11110:1161-2039(+)